MRMMFSFIGLLLVLASIGITVKNQLQSPSPPMRANSTDLPAGVTVPMVNAGNAKQVQDQIKRDLENALQQGAQREIQ